MLSDLTTLKPLADEIWGSSVGTSQLAPALWCSDTEVVVYHCFTSSLRVYQGTGLTWQVAFVCWPGSGWNSLWSLTLSAACPCCVSHSSLALAAALMSQESALDGPQSHRRVQLGLAPSSLVALWTLVTAVDLSSTTPDSVWNGTRSAITLGIELDFISPLFWAEVDGCLVSGGLILRLWCFV